MAHDGRLLGSIGVLVTVAEAGSFVRAADALGITQSGVSRAVARLERRVGIRMFDRSARSVTLTHEGRQLLDEVAPLIDAIEEATSRAAGAAVAVRGRLRVAADGAFAHNLLAAALPRFLALHPQLTVELEVRDRPGDFVGEGFDVAVRFGEPEGAGLTCRRLFESRVLTCASPTYVARHGAPATPAELERHEWIHFRDPATGRPFHRELRRGKERVPIAAGGRLTVNDTESLLAACLAGHGVAQVLEVYAGKLIADGHLVQLLPDWADERFPAYVYHRSRRLPSARVRAFVDFVLTLG